MTHDQLDARIAFVNDKCSSTNRWRLYLPDFENKSTVSIMLDQVLIMIDRGIFEKSEENIYVIDTTLSATPQYASIKAYEFLKDV